MVGRLKSAVRERGGNALGGARKASAGLLSRCVGLVDVIQPQAVWFPSSRRDAPVHLLNDWPIWAGGGAAVAMVYSLLQQSPSWPL